MTKEQLKNQPTGLELPEASFTPQRSLLTALKESQLVSMHLSELDETELFSLCQKLILDKEILRETVKHLRDKIIKDAAGT